MAEYQIMTDATADFPEGMQESLGITVIPMIVEMSGKDYTIGDKENAVNLAEFYNHLEQGEVARTSQVTMNVYTQYFEEEFKKGRDVLLVSFSSGLSKSFEASLLCAEKMKIDYPDRKLYCVDSLCAAGGQGLLVYSAVQRQRQGATIDELAVWLEDHKLDVEHWVTVDELDTLLRGGRISKTSAAVGTMLNIKPIIQIDREGKLIPVNKVRGRKKSLETMAQAYRDHRASGIEDLVLIGYGTDKESAGDLRELIVADGGPKEVLFAPIGPVIGAHTGPTVVTLFFFGDKNNR